MINRLICIHCYKQVIQMSAFTFYFISILSSLKFPLPHVYTPYILRPISLLTYFKALSSLRLGRKAMQFHSPHLSPLIINGFVKSIIIYFLWSLVPPLPLTPHHNHYSNHCVFQTYPPSIAFLYLEVK
jgi:hypothetical protein